MIVDCKSITEELKDDLRGRVEASGKALTLAIFKAPLGDPLLDAQTEAFLKQKQACGKEVSIDVREYLLSGYMESQSTVESYISNIVRQNHVSAAIVQLPLPEHIGNVQAILNKIYPEKDVDVLHYKSFGRFETGNKVALVPPNVAAVQEILRRHAPDLLNLTGKNFVIVGQGRVVGLQMKRWTIQFKTAVDAALDIGSDIAYYTKHADIIVSCVGKKGLITADMVKDGVAIFDFGVSKEASSIGGDVNPVVAEKARLMTPVPGGVGPLAVVKLFENVAHLNGIRA